MMEHCNRQVTTPIRRWLVLFAIAIIFIGVAVGCSIDARYRIKTVIFTGVPPLHEEQATDEVEPSQDPLATAAEKVAQQQQHRESLLPRYWQHGPFAAGECGRCHSLDQSRSFSVGGAINQAPSSASTVSASSRLTMPKQKLCITCHTQHSTAFAQDSGLLQHPPSATGLCTNCHSPHQSLRRYMLLKADNKELCSGCHTPMTLSAVHAENPQQDCVECHNAHVGVSKPLLRSDAEEIALLYGSGDD